MVIATSNGDVKKRVAQGEVAMGLTDTDDANEALKEGAPVKAVFLDQLGFGNLIVPNTVSLLKNSPHPGNGKLMDYLLSRETEAKLARSCAQMPLHAGVRVPPAVPSLDNIVPMTRRLRRYRPPARHPQKLPQAMGRRPVKISLTRVLALMLLRCWQPDRWSRRPDGRSGVPTHRRLRFTEATGLRCWVVVWGLPGPSPRSPPDWDWVLVSASAKWRCRGKAGCGC